jgi:hypothetical protein
MTETAERSTDTTDDQDTDTSSALPSDRLKQAAETLLRALGDRAVSSAVDRVEGLTGRLSDVAESGGEGLSGLLGGGGGGDSSDGGGGLTGALKSGASSIKDKVTGALGMGSDDDDDAEGDAYDQWTQFADFPSFMKKVETVNQEADEKSTWTAKVFWSRRSWDTTIREQIPDSHILWVSSGAKGHADGIVTFSELAPNLTRIVLILEYYPQGFFEKTGNLWRAVGRRARLEFKHFCRHVMMDTLINRDELEGWRGEIRDSEVVKTHEEAMEEEQAAADEDGFEDEDDLDADDEAAEDTDEDDSEDLEDEPAAEDDVADDELEDDADEDLDAEDTDTEDTDDVEDDAAVDEADDGEDSDDGDAADASEDQQDAPEEDEPEPAPRRPRRRQRTPA